VVATIIVVGASRGELTPFFQESPTTEPARLRWRFPDHHSQRAWGVNQVSPADAPSLRGLALGDHL